MLIYNNCLSKLSLVCQPRQTTLIVIYLSINIYRLLSNIKVSTGLNITTSKIKCLNLGPNSHTLFFNGGGAIYVTQMGEIYSLQRMKSLHTDKLSTILISHRGREALIPLINSQYVVKPKAIFPMLAKRGYPQQGREALTITSLPPTRCGREPSSFFTLLVKAENPSSFLTLLVMAEYPIDFENLLSKAFKEVGKNYEEQARDPHY
ncbi:hypothetical protein IEQ34_019637 [Dendrobium chrysotoxum]|uniref:Uncharacterized protein n=1 Tax=Dendrobium chrysotoxum TaxID=161865 RepID=A0AAV7G9J9_DENCH|nr:hypothetical protein IEQ34_019637 [Dendrobium chrysotoxum]